MKQHYLRYFLCIVVLIIILALLLCRKSDQPAEPQKDEVTRSTHIEQSKSVKPNKNPEHNIQLPKKMRRQTFHKATEMHIPKADSEAQAAAAQIRLNSADEPEKIEAPEIMLDENDNPLLDETGKPVLKQ